jgi:hypothetical protein
LKPEYKLKAKVWIMVKPKIELYLNCSSDYRIVDNHGQEYTPQEAKALVDADQVFAWNVGFGRLIQENYDIEATKRFYKQHP